MGEVRSEKKFPYENLTEIKKSYILTLNDHSNQYGGRKQMSEVIRTIANVISIVNGLITFVKAIKDVILKIFKKDNK